MCERERETLLVSHVRIKQQALRLGTNASSSPVGPIALNGPANHRNMAAVPNVFSWTVVPGILPLFLLAYPLIYPEWVHASAQGEWFNILTVLGFGLGASIFFFFFLFFF